MRTGIRTRTRSRATSCKKSWFIL